MTVVSRGRKALILMAALTIPMAGSWAQDGAYADEQALATVYGIPIPPLSEMTAGPEVEGIIYARKGDQIQVAGDDGNSTVVAISHETKIKAKGGFLGMNSSELAAGALMNGLPVKIETMRWNNMLVASRIDLKSKDLKTAAMIHGGTDQRFNQQEAATEALRGRMADIDKYNIKGVTNVHFDTGKYALTPEARDELCSTAATAEGMDNAMLLVVGYTDSTGSYEFNQALSEKRAARVVNHLQQACGWKPYRMLTPTGMAEADPLADNTTEEGKAQNRRVAVNILVSKGLDGL